METSDSSGYAAFSLLGGFRDSFFSLPEEVQEQVNAHADEFRSGEEMRRYIRELMLRG